MKRRKIIHHKITQNYIKRFLPINKIAIKNEDEENKESHSLSHHSENISSSEALSFEIKEEDYQRHQEIKELI